MEKIIRIFNHNEFVSKAQAKRHLTQLANRYDKVTYDLKDASEYNYTYIKFLAQEIKRHSIGYDIEIELINSNPEIEEIIKESKEQIMN